MRISLRGISKRFGNIKALDCVSLDVADRELFFLLGPSGCGKTTLLRIVAGFTRPDAGEVWFGDRCLNGVPPHKRNTGMVFQNYALWPHMTVAENVAYGLEVRGLKRDERDRLVNEALQAVRLESVADRRPSELSGGQQQRVALARALVIRPDVLLLDEPLSNLDARLRLELREEIRRIHDQTHITTLYVTHDQKESLSMADRIAVMRSGVVEQVGDPRAVYSRPATRFVADFIGECNWLPGTINVNAEGSCFVITDSGQFEVHDADGFNDRQSVWVGFRPEAVHFGVSQVNQFRAKVAQTTYLGEVEQYVLELPGGITIKALDANPVEIRPRNTEWPVYVSPRNVFLFPRSD